MKLNAKKRDLKKSVNKLRINKQIPAILYGKKIKSQPLKVNYLEFANIYKEAGESTIIELNIDKKTKNTLIKNIQFHPVTDNILHIDFYQINMKEKITANVELKFTGISKAVKDEEGVLVKNIDEIEVECLPANLPKEIIVDISPLETFEDVIKIKDLPISQDIKVDLDPQEVVATVTPPRSEEELEALKEDVEENVEDVEGVKEEEPAEGEKPAEEKKETAKTEEEAKPKEKDQTANKK